MTRLFLPAVVAVTVSLGAGNAHASARTQEQQEEMNRMTVALKELAARDSEHLATTELGNAEAWLKEAQSLAKRRRTRDAFRQSMDRVTAMAELVDALLLGAEAQTVASAATEKATSVEKAAADARAEEETLGKRRAQLEGAVSR